MALLERYLSSTKNIPGIFSKIVEGTAPEKFNREHLAGIGFGGSNDRAIIPLLKDLGFLSADGTPTSRYHQYRDQSRSREVLGRALIEAYGDLFTINENPTTRDRKAIEGKFKSTHNATERVAKEQASTFFSLLKLADLEAARDGSAPPDAETPPSASADDAEPEARIPEKFKPAAIGLRYNIEVHLPPTKDIEVYNAIFKALKEHLLVD